MSSESGTHGQDHSDLVLQYALQALPSSDVRGVEAQISARADCRQEMEALRPIIDSFVSWPIDVLAPIGIALGTPRARIAAETGGAPVVPVGATAMGGAGMERGGAWHLLQGARDRYGEEPREHDGAARAGSRLPAPPPSRR